jgi:hypothetical protein
MKKEPKLASIIRQLPRIQSLEWEVDQWVCYTYFGYWFPDLECETCIDTRLSEILWYAKRANRAPESYLNQK